jgi:hypothetical protein
VLTNSRKKDIETQINSLSAVGIKCKIVDPDYLFVKLDSKVHVDFNNTKSSTSLIISKITAAVKNYNVNALQNFNTALRTSKLEQKINESDVGIISNETSSYIFKIFDVPLNIPYAIYCDLNNPIIKGTVISESFVSMGSNFVFTDFIDGVDLGTGKIYILEKKLSTSKQNYTEIGTVNYVDGSIKIGQIEYFNTDGGIRIYAQPKNQDIYCMNNNIIEIDTINGLTFNVVSN